MPDESIRMKDDQIYRELITIVLHSNDQPNEFTVEEQISLLDKLLEASDNLDPHKFIVRWLQNAL